MANQIAVEVSPEALDDSFDRINFLLNSLPAQINRVKGNPYPSNIAHAINLYTAHMISVRETLPAETTGLLLPYETEFPLRTVVQFNQGENRSIIGIHRSLVSARNSAPIDTLLPNSVEEFMFDLDRVPMVRDTSSILKLGEEEAAAMLSQVCIFNTDIETGKTTLQSVDEITFDILMSQRLGGRELLFNRKNPIIIEASPSLTPFALTNR